LDSRTEGHSRCHNFLLVRDLGIEYLADLRNHEGQIDHHPIQFTMDLDDAHGSGSRSASQIDDRG
jgi:hypothetical protein